MLALFKLSFALLSALQLSIVSLHLKRGLLRASLEQTIASKKYAEQFICALCGPALRRFVRFFNCSFLLGVFIVSYCAVKDLSTV